VQSEWGEDYGSYCAAWEDDVCRDPAHLFISGPGHTCGTLTGCKEMWGTDYDFAAGQSWCCDSWCYVNPTTCTQEIADKYGITVNPSWLDIEGLWYSYGACEDDQSFPQDPKGSPYDHTNHAVTLRSMSTYTAKTCPYSSKALLSPKEGLVHACACIPKAELHSLLGQWPDYVQSKWGEDYGSYCAAWEDGACADASSESCSSGPGHTCGTLTGCKEMWEADYDFSKDQKWCCDSWCYVNPATCTLQIANQYGFTVNPSWLDIEGLWYSYGVCESDQSFPQDPKGSPYDHTNHAVTLTSTAAYTESTCPYKVQPTGCECTGNNNALGYDEKLLHGQDYGRWCAAWEDGLVTSGPATTVQEMGGGKHTGGGTLGEGCHNHWPTYDFSKPQGWCCDAWFRGLGFRIEGLGLRV